VFADCELTTGNIDVSKIEALVTPRTKAIAVVHFVGIPCAMPTIIAIAERHRLNVIEDCALAVGHASGARTRGSFGNAGCFSFYPVQAHHNG